MSKSVSKNEILTPDVEVMDLESSISTALVKANITNQVLSELKDRYGNVRLKSIDDRESYLECKSASKEIRKVEIIIEKICEVGRSEAIKIQRLWLSKQKELLATTGETKNPIDGDIEKFEQEEERIALLEKKQAEDRWMGRQQELTKLGAIYNDGNFELGHISYEVDAIKQSDDEFWQGIIKPKYQKVYDQVQKEAADAEEKRRLEIAEMKRQQEELAQQKADMEKQRNEMLRMQEDQARKIREQQEAFDKKVREQKEEEERQERIAKQKKEAEEYAAKQKMYETRSSQLFKLGMEFNLSKNAYCFGDDIIVEIDAIKSLSDIAWDESTIPAVTTGISIIKQKDAEIAEAKEKERIKEIEEAARQKAADDLAKEKQRKEEELAQATDKTKWAAILSRLGEVYTEELVMKSRAYIRKVTILVEKIEEIKSL